MYQPYPLEKFQKLPPDWLFQELAAHIAPQAESQPYVTDLTRVVRIPVEVATIYFLWNFYCEAGGGGIEVFLLNSRGNQTPSVHKALQEIGADEVIERLEAGIPHALETGCAEFSAGPEVNWFEQFPKNPRYPTLQSVDVDIYEMVNDGIMHKCNAYIRKHQGIFVA